MTALTLHEVETALGSVEDHFAAAILATGASLEEFNQAQAWRLNDEAAMNAGQPLPSGRVGLLIDILKSAEDSLLSNPSD